MQRVFTGIIVASLVERIGKSEMRSGFITIKISEDEYVQLDVGSYTAFDTLDEGTKVRVEIDTLGETGVLYAKSVTLVDEIS